MSEELAVEFMSLLYTLTIPWEEANWSAFAINVGLNFKKKFRDMDLDVYEYTFKSHLSVVVIFITGKLQGISIILHDSDPLKNGFDPSDERLYNDDFETDETQNREIAKMEDEFKHELEIFVNDLTSKIGVPDFYGTLEDTYYVEDIAGYVQVYWRILGGYLSASISYDYGIGWTLRADIVPSEML